MTLSLFTPVFVLAHLLSQRQGDVHIRMTPVYMLIFAIGLLTVLVINKRDHDE